MSFPESPFSTSMRDELKAEPDQKNGSLARPFVEAIKSPFSLVGTKISKLLADNRARREAKEYNRLWGDN